MIARAALASHKTVAAIQPAQSPSSLETAPVAKTVTACRSAVAAAAGPSVTSRARVDQPRRIRGWGKRPGGAGDLEHVAGARQAPGQRCRPPGVQVGLTR